MASIQGNNNTTGSSKKNSIHLHRNHSFIRSISSRQPPIMPGGGSNGCPILSSPDSHDTAPILPGRRDVGVGCNRLLGLAPLATACSSSAASSFYSSMLGAECSVSLRSRTDRNSLTPARPANQSSQAGSRGGRLATSKFHHSKSHSIASSPRETTPVRHSAVISVRSEKFADRQKTASLPLPKRRQLSLSATESTGAGLGEAGMVVDHHPAPDDHRSSSRANIPGEEAGDNCSFDTATSGLGGPQHARDSSCTLNSNSYKEQYILGCGHYRSNLKHYDALLAGGCVTGEKEPAVAVEKTVDGESAEGDLVMVELGEKGRRTPRPSGGQATGVEDEKIAAVQPKTHHYPTNAKSLEDIL